jgi:hypothetical protein
LFVRLRLSSAPAQQGSRGGEPDRRRRIFLVHDFGDHSYGGLAMRAGQCPDIDGAVGFVCFHETKVGGVGGAHQLVLAAGCKLQGVLIPEEGNWIARIKRAMTVMGREPRGRRQFQKARAAHIARRPSAGAKTRLPLLREAQPRGRWP